MMNFKDMTPVSPQKCLCISALDGYETFMINENTIGVRPFWKDAKTIPPRKDIPILVVTEFDEMPNVVRWLEEGTYGDPGFYEANDEYETKQEAILYWMAAPEVPK